MDHGTLALLWGMMIIVGVVAKTGVFEYMAVRLYQYSGGEPFKLLVMICMLDIILSAFLDNVTTMLLLAPVCVQLCEAVGRDPRPFLISLALYGNIGGTATMIGDPPNIIIGNMLSEYVTFNDFITYLSPACIICLPFSFWLTKIFWLTRPKPRASEARRKRACRIDHRRYICFEILQSRSTAR